MKTQNMLSSNGNPVPNQFELFGDGKRIFQSYRSTIAVMEANKPTLLDAEKWDYSVTTGKYRNQFLGESIKETRAKIASGEYILTNLN